jgi:hypothetical protein
MSLKREAQRLQAIDQDLVFQLFEIHLMGLLGFQLGHQCTESFNCAEIKRWRL